MGLDKFVIGYVHGGFLREEFSDSLVRLVTADNAGDRRLERMIKVGGPLIPQNRNTVVERFLAISKAPWLVFIDTDVRFQPTDMWRLLDAADATERPIVAGLYFSLFENKIRPVWGKKVEGGPFMITTCVPRELQRLDVVGMGFTVIHRRVLTAMRDAHKGDNWSWFGHDLVDGIRVSEDFSFCERARALGFSIWGEGRVNLGHVKSIELNLALQREQRGALNTEEIAVTGAEDA